MIESYSQIFQNLKKDIYSNVYFDGRGDFLY